MMTLIKYHNLSLILTLTLEIRCQFFQSIQFFSVTLICAPSPRACSFEQIQLSNINPTLHFGEEASEVQVDSYSIPSHRHSPSLSLLFPFPI
jgi:hypothetical protein